MSSDNALDLLVSETTLVDFEILFDSLMFRRLSHFGENIRDSDAARSQCRNKTT
jgi:hypothetical protein